MSLFQGENRQTQYNLLSNRIDLHIHDYNLAIEIDENGHSDRNINYEIKRGKGIKKELGCKFIRPDPGKQEFMKIILIIFKTINEIFRHSKQSTKKL